MQKLVTEIEISRLHCMDNTMSTKDAQTLKCSPGLIPTSISIKCVTEMVRNEQMHN